MSRCNSANRLENKNSFICVHISAGRFACHVVSASLNCALLTSDCTCIKGKEGFAPCEMPNEQHKTRKLRQHMPPHCHVISQCPFVIWCLGSVQVHQYTLTLPANFCPNRLHQFCEHPRSNSVIKRSFHTKTCCFVLANALKKQAGWKMIPVCFSCIVRSLLYRCDAHCPMQQVQRSYFIQSQRSKPWCENGLRGSFCVWTVGIPTCSPHADCPSLPCCYLHCP